MNYQEANVLITVIAAGDNRSTDDRSVEYWRDMLSDISFEDALEAVVIHRREFTEWMQPAHVRRIVKQRRNLRGAASNVIYEPDAADSVELDIRKRRALMRRAADGQLGVQPVGLALAVPAVQAALPEAVASCIEAVRTARRPLDVRCPYCHAGPGIACRATKSAPQGFMHPARREAYASGAAEEVS